MRRRRLSLALLVAALIALASLTVYAAVDLANFNGEWTGDTVRLQWETGSENNIALFNVWRSEENLSVQPNGQIDTSRATKLTDTAIPAENSCEATGAVYDYPDSEVEPDVNTYYYYLQVMDFCPGGSGGSEFEGSLTNSGGLRVDRPGTRRDIFLPQILSRPAP